MAKPTKVVSIGSMLPDTQNTSPSAAKASSIKLYRAPRPDTLMPGLTADQNEYEELSNFFDATSPIDLKWRMFTFRDQVLNGSLVIAETKAKD